MELICNNEKGHIDEGTLDRSWISVTCNAMGSTDPAAGPPPDAVAAVKALLVEMTSMCLEEPKIPKRTNVDARLLEAWRLAAGDPDDQVGKWMLVGAPTGI